MDSIHVLLHKYSWTLSTQRCNPALRKKWEVLQSKGVSSAVTAVKVWLVLIIYT